MTTNHTAPGERTKDPTAGCRVLVVGGGYAGLLAAVSLAGRTRDSAVSITLIDPREHFVERIRLHQLATGQHLPGRAYRQLLSGTGVTFCQGWARAIDPGNKSVYLETGEGTARAVQTLDYDHLILAVGSTVDVLSVPGVAEHAHSLSGWRAGQRLCAALTSMAAGARLLIVGGGLTGIEAASEIAERHPHLAITLATRGRFGDNLSQTGAAYQHRVFANLGIQIQEKTEITHLSADAAHAHNAPSLPFDLCLWAGAFTVSPLARDSGLPTNDTGQVLVDPQLRALGHPSLYVVGDAAATPLRMACATAMPMAAHAAAHLAAMLTGGREPAPFRFAYALRCISLGRRRALVQFVKSDDRPRSLVLTGRLGAVVKEQISRYTLWSVHLAKVWPDSYIWPKAKLAWQVSTSAAPAGDRDARQAKHAEQSIPTSIVEPARAALDTGNPH